MSEKPKRQKSSNRLDTHFDCMANEWTPASAGLNNDTDADGSVNERLLQHKRVLAEHSVQCCRCL